MKVAAGFLAVGLACYGLVFHLLPAAVVRLGRALGRPMELNPLTQKRLRRFREVRRGYWSFVLLATLFVMSFFLELYVNRRPLYIRYGDTRSFPAVANWANFLLPWVELPDRVMAADYGLKQGGELPARDYARWVRDPAVLEEEARRLEADIAADRERFRRILREQAVKRGLEYDPDAPLPEWKQKEYAELRSRAESLRTLRREFEAGKAAILMPLYPYSPDEQLLDLPGAPPHKPFTPGVPFLGTDFGGRDVFSQLLYGFRISMSFSLAVAGIGYLIGVLVGGAMGYYGGWFDICVQRLIEIWSSIPFLYTIIILASVMSPTFWVLVGVLVLLVGWTGITYYMRGEFFRERSRDYVQAARALGVRDLAVMVRHILPNSLVPVVTFLPFAIVAYMSTLVSLDFLGFGLPPGTPSWGALLRQGSENIVNHPQLVYIPVLAFAGTLFCVVLVGEAVREAFDPKRYARLR